MLKRVLVTFVAACTLSATSLAFAAEQTHVKFTTTAGDFEIALDNEKAPQTVENFKQYVTDKFYDDTTFHRVIPGFMVQGGGFTADMNQKQTRPPVKNEADTACVTCAAPLRWRVPQIKTVQPASSLLT